MNRIKTTVVGSYPKPDYLTIPTWFDGNEALYNPETYSEYLRSQDPEELEKTLQRASLEVIKEQEDIGLDLITDGELHRENYIHYFCRHLNGISFDLISKKQIRDNHGIKSPVPTIVGPISIRDYASVHEWDPSRSERTPMKITLPGPMTILDTLANEYYKEEKLASRDISRALRAEILNLVKMGCRHIQIDEPVMARKAKVALEYGIQHIEFCLKDLPGVQKTLHICCGYPNFLDQDDYQKAPKDAYHKLAARLDKSSEFGILSIEDAEAQNDLTLFNKFKNKTIMLGSVCSARSRVETVAEIEGRLREVLAKLGDNPNRLIASPDCGLGMLPREVAQQKLKNMVQAVKNINDSFEDKN